MTAYVIDWTRPEAYLGRVPRSRWRRLLARLDGWLAAREGEALRRELDRMERRIRYESYRMPAWLKRDIGIE